MNYGTLVADTIAGRTDGESELTGIAVIGLGSFGTALARNWTVHGKAVRGWTVEEEAIRLL